MKHQMNIKPRKMLVECPSCSENINVGNNPKIGRIVTCGSCDEQFEIIEINPLMVDWPYTDDDFFDGDDSDEDDYEY